LFVASGGLITVIGKAGAKAIASSPATKKAHETLEDASPWLNKEQPKGGGTVGDTAKLDKPTQEMLDDPYHPDWNRYDGPEKMGVGADRVRDVDAPTKEKMLGEDGVQTASKTLWKGKGKERIDVENPNPGQRPGQIHYQDNSNNKYLYDPKTNTFPDAPRSVNKLLEDKKFKSAIDKALTKYLGE